MIRVRTCVEGISYTFLRGARVDECHIDRLSDDHGFENNKMLFQSSNSVLHFVDVVS